MRSLASLELLEHRIYLVRGHRVMLDSDLARIYGVTTARLNQQLHRNRERFPPDFAFELRKGEYANLMLQSATSSFGYGGRRKLPLVFTEHGAVMLAAVLHSPVAVDASIQIARTFVRLRQMVSTNRDLARKLKELERRVAHHDEHIQSLFDAIRQIMEPPIDPKPRIGFDPRKG